MRPEARTACNSTGEAGQRHPLHSCSKESRAKDSTARTLLTDLLVCLPTFVSAQMEPTSARAILPGCKSIFANEQVDAQRALERELLPWDREYAAAPARELRGAGSRSSCGCIPLETMAIACSCPRLE